MSDKVDNQLFEDELEKIKSLINQLGSSGKDIKMPIIAAPSGP